MELQFSSEAAEFFRLIPLFDRLPLIDLFDDMKVGRIPEEDYGEITKDGLPISVLIIEKYSVSYYVNHEKETIQVAEIRPADQ